MRCSAAIPAIALYAGITAGIYFSLPTPTCLLLGLFVCAVASYCARRDRATTILIFSGFLVAGAALGRDADSASRHQELRADFDRRVAPPQHQLFATIEGRLRADALSGPSGVTLDVLVDRIELDGFAHSTGGGALIGVAGQPEGDRILQWRGGRRVAFPATLRTPTKYLDPGVGDAERQLAWRGVALVGSVKSDRLVDVTSRGTRFTEALASARAAVRRAVASSVSPWSTRSAAIVSAILIGDRAGLDHEVERRLQEAGTYHVIAISGGNIAILAGLSMFLLRLCRAGPRVTAVAVICRADRVRLYRRGRVVGRSSHADGGDLPHGAARRPPRIADERRGIDCGDSVLRRSRFRPSTLDSRSRSARRWASSPASRRLRAPFLRHRGCVRRPRCSLRPRARKSRCCRSARSCSRA